ncbi:MAG: regA [Phycisphaerales bacterium]|jgi:DNA-binding response OmpR family regulator|nr:regA [Phycisphaerales bacterium]MDB5301839.1 regA [Phycisphaerales bacterium]MDB5304484.1 regA [Phycisphaerales bacterium]
MSEQAMYGALIVEDDPDNCEWMARALSKGGCEIDFAMTLADALEKLANKPPHCVVLDLGLPDGNGIEILRLIRQLELPIKVAIVSGNTDYSTVGTAFLLEPDAFFRKPVNARELMSWVAAGCC